MLLILFLCLLKWFLVLFLDVFSILLLSWLVRILFCCVFYAFGLFVVGYCFALLLCWFTTWFWLIVFMFLWVCCLWIPLYFGVFCLHFELLICSVVLILKSLFGWFTFLWALVFYLMIVYLVVLLIILPICVKMVYCMMFLLFLLVFVVLLYYFMI